MVYREGAAPSRVFYGWWVAAAFSLIIFVSTGIRFAVGPFLKPVVDDPGLDRGSFSLVISLSLFLYGAFMPVIGPLVDRWGSRVVSSVGAVVIAASLDLSGGYGLAFAVSCGLLLLGAGLSLTINPADRPRARGLLQPVAGGR
jgi:MFS family permease